MKKIGIVICYFGNVPSYFDLWKKSALRNDDINFLFFTDQDTIKSEKNLIVNHMSFNELKSFIQNKFDFKISLKTPYKMCDYKPAYGYIFSEYLKDYDFWGYCDIDLIFGNIRKFITEDILSNNDIILNLGHLTLYRNNEICKNLFKKNGSLFSYKIVYSTDEFYAFDEMSGMHMIQKENNIKPYLSIPIADIDRRFSRFLLDGGNNYEKQFFYFDNGIYRKYRIENSDYIEEYCYLHFQKRVPKIYSTQSEKYFINKEGVFDYDAKFDFFYNRFEGLKKEKKELIKYRLNMIKKFCLYSYKRKYIWIRQKISNLKER